MRFRLLQYPIYVPLYAYEDAIQRMIEKLSCQEGVVSIFQVGSIAAPGISDLDLVVVFKDGTLCNLNPLEGLSRLDQYLFNHALYGTSSDYFRIVRSYPYFQNYRLLWGTELPSRNLRPSTQEIETSKTQIALEYLVKMYITRSIELTYGIVRVRELLLQAKALLCDLDFLGIHSGIFCSLINKVVRWRENWFQSKPDKVELVRYVVNLYEQLTQFLRKRLKAKDFYLPSDRDLRIAPNIKLVPSGKLEYEHKGFTLPIMFAGLGKKYFNLQHRFNKFLFKIPLNNSSAPDVLHVQFELIENMKAYNNSKLPHFMPLGSSLNLI